MSDKLLDKENFRYLLSILIERVVFIDDRKVFKVLITKKDIKMYYVDL